MLSHVSFNLASSTNYIACGIVICISDVSQLALNYFFTNPTQISCCIKFFKHMILIWVTVYTRVQVERVYKSNPIFEAKNTTFLEKV